MALPVIMEGVDFDLPAHVTGRLAVLAPDGGRLLAAVSGGADSVALLRAMVEAGLDVAVAHLDHSLRPASEEDARFVEELAAAYGLEVRTERVEVARVAKERGQNVEDAARRIRYEFLARSARELGARGVVTAHTLDDQAETVLMQLLRGAAYLRGMRERKGKVLRPLLDVPGWRLREFLTRLEQSWREDVTNLDRSRLRAWLRHEILPMMLERFPDLARRLGRHAVLQGDVEEFVRSEAYGLLEGSGSESGFAQRDLATAPPALQREAIRLLLERAAVAPDSDRIEEVRTRLAQEHPYRMSLTPDTALRLAYGRLELARTARRPGDRPVRSASQLPPGVPTTVLDAVPGNRDLRLRGRLPGDRMRLPGGSKSLARVLIDHKIPREERDALTVLARGSQVLWAEGIGPAVGLEPGEGSYAPKSADERFMRRALELAAIAARSGELPVGAVVVKDGEILAEAHNETEGGNDPTAHAEILALRRAAAAAGDWRLPACTLYVTLEPCPMCAGAMLEAHLGAVVFGAGNPRDGALGGVTDLLAAPWKRRVRVRAGVLAEEAGRALTEFFRERRQP